MIPKILHQTWKTSDLSGIPEFQACASTWKQYHPDYEYMFWDDAQCQRFVEQKFNWYLDTWTSFDKDIKRYDSIRYMWMYEYGGIYADIDLECLQNLDGLFVRNENREIILFCDLDAQGNCISANPALIGSRRGSEFWIKMLEFARNYSDCYVTRCTGPSALGVVASEYGGAYKVALLDQNRLFIRKNGCAFYRNIEGNGTDHVVYLGVFCTSDKPEKFEYDRRRKLVADWHGTPAEHRWRNQYDNTDADDSQPVQLKLRRDLRALHGVHDGETASIVASGPSAVAYAGGTDVSIAVNGGILLGRSFEYFMCGDMNSPRRPWFYRNNARSRVIARMVATADPRLYPGSSFSGLRRVVTMEDQGTLVLPDPKPPHYIYEYRDFDPKRLKRTNFFLMRGATISGCAVQLAYLMGCTLIRLFGCSFIPTNEKCGAHYFYECPENQQGTLHVGQLRKFDALLREIRHQGVRVHVYGESRISEYDEAFPVMSG